MGETPCRKNFCFFTFIPFSCIYSNTVSPSLLLRFNSAPNSMEVRFIEWEKNGSCTDFGRDLQGRNDFQCKCAKKLSFFNRLK